MPGFLQNKDGENSSTKLFTTVYGMALICVWVVLSWREKRMIPFEPTTVAPLGMGQIANSINKLIEVLGYTDKAKFIKAIMEKVKK